jgi:hypothetical protein
MPWEVVGNNAFGRNLSLERFYEIIKSPDRWDHLLHNASIPISALQSATIRIAPYR